MKRPLLGLALFALAALSQQYKPAAIAQANQGVNLSKQGKFREAIQAYQRAAAIDPTLPNLNLNLGLAYFKIGDFRAALAAFEKEPANDRITTLKGMSYFGLAQYKQAAVLLKPLADSQPQNSELAYLLAKCYVWSGESDAAMALFRQLLAGDPDSVAVHMLLGEALDAQNHADDAIKEFEIAAKNSPAQPEVHFGLGYLYWKQKRYDDAAREFRLELGNNPRDGQALAYLGDVELRAQDASEALVHLKKSIAIERNYHLAHQDLGMLYLQQKRNDLALFEFHEAIRCDPSSFNAHYRLARLLKELGRQAEADKEFAIVQQLHEKKTEEPLLRISPAR